MNRILRNKHLADVRKQIEAQFTRNRDAEIIELVCERVGESSDVVYEAVRRARKAEAKAVHCARCEAPLTYYSAVRIDVYDFCKPCRTALFADHETAVREFPAIFDEAHR